ncbi:MAG: head-tail connector protein [Desulfobacterales bacterium]
MSQSNRYTISVAPTTEPVTVEEAKKNSIIEFDDDDAYVSGLIKVARQYVEEYLSRALITQTWKLYLDCFPNVIEIPVPPLVSATITYVDTDGATQTESSAVYTVDTDSDPGIIYEAYNQNWSTPRDVEKAVIVTFVAGYGAADDVPDPIKQAIKLLVGHYYENREQTSPLTMKEIPMGIKMLLAPYRITSF